MRVVQVQYASTTYVLLYCNKGMYAHHTYLFKIKLIVCSTISFLLRRNWGVYIRLLGRKMNDIQYTSSAPSFFTENNDFDDLTTIVQLELTPLGTFQISLALNDNVQQVADVFLSQNSLPSTLKERIVKELYQVQQDMCTTVYELYRDLRNELCEKNESLCLAEKNAQLAANHISVLTKSLDFLQHSVPALIANMKEKDTIIESLQHESSRLQEALTNAQLELDYARSTECEVGQDLSRRDDCSAEYTLERKTTPASLSDRTSIAAVNAENVKLKEQTVRLRREILKLKGKIEDIQTSAIEAVGHFQSMGVAPSAHSSVDNETPALMLGVRNNKSIIRDITRTPDAVSKDEELVSPGNYTADNSVMLKPHMADFARSTESVMPAVNAPAVEDRVVRAIFARFADAGDATMSLSRYLRFAKECGVTPGGPAPAAAAAIAANPAKGM